ncbi:MAG TPA: hypothetical protein VMW25_04260 [Clostridia bacterium]|nr:hypothetical protein [Clostridia bacterium]
MSEKVLDKKRLMKWLDYKIKWYDKKAENHFGHDKQIFETTRFAYVVLATMIEDKKFDKKAGEKK